MEVKAREAEFLINTAPTKDEALKNAIQAVEYYMKATKFATNDRDRMRLRSKCEKLLSRAEEIKSLPEWRPSSSTSALRVPISQRTLSKREQIILREASNLNGFVFPPWISDPEDALFEEALDGSSYIEPQDLELSDVQRRIFDGWRRVTDLIDNLSPAAQNFIVAHESEIDLVQDITTDCSVVASLCAEMARTAKGHGKLLASVMYPYDRVRGQPRLSKSGKYIFRLHFNGCFRRVVIDDRLPTSNTQRSLHVIDRKHPRLVWPALLEKAYLKVRGGYDFPGSNSGTDLWVLTGWIPEQVFLQSEDLQPDQLWNRVYKAFGYGDVMITLGTGGLTQNEEKGLGLVGQHDYAVLDMREVGSQHLLLVKNPWCDGMIWQGSSSGSETQSTPIPESSRQALSRDIPDNTNATGTFWIDFENVAQHFESLYLNWNPGLFLHRQDHHFSWTLPNIKSPGSFAHNPQFSLVSTGKETVWILLSRHFINGEQALVKNRINSLSSSSGPLGFISLYVFEASGEKVYLSDDALYRGAFVDSPQTLARLEVSPSLSYTIVVAEHGLPLPNYSFTLSFFSRSDLAIDTALNRFPHCSIHTGGWTVRTAGGNASSPSYPINPQFGINVSAATDIVLILETDQEGLAVHVKMVWAGGKRVTGVTTKDIVGGSGDYRRGCALASLSDVAAGRYTIVCSTFEAGQTGKFTLRVMSTTDCSVKPLVAETAGRLSLRLPLLVFQKGVDRMLAPLTLSRMTKLRILGKSVDEGQLVQSVRSKPSLKISVERGQGPNKTILDVSSNGEFSDAPMGIRTNELDLSTTMNQQGGLWIVIERLGGRHEHDIVALEILSDSPVDVGTWGLGNG